MATDSEWCFLPRAPVPRPLSNCSWFPVGAVTLWDGRGVSWAGLGGSERSHMMLFLAHSRFNPNCFHPAQAAGLWREQRVTRSATSPVRAGLPIPHLQSPRSLWVVPLGEMHPVAGLTSHPAAVDRWLGLNTPPGSQRLCPLTKDSGQASAGLCH